MVTLALNENPSVFPHRLLLLLACFTALLLPPPPANADDSLTVVQVRLGNVFVRGEPVEIRVQTTGDSLVWTVRDFYGQLSSGGPAAVGDTKAAKAIPGQNTAATGPASVVIRPASADRLGFFELHLVARRADKVVAQADTTFAVLPPGDVRKLADSSFGVMTHFAQGWDTALMPLIARAGWRHVRDEQYWQQVEPQRGRYVYGDRYRAYMAAAAANGLDPLVELTFGNDQYDHDPARPGTAWAPCTDEGRAGYANYAAALLKQYPSQIGTLEVWNEYNGTWCDGPASTDRAASYTRMLKTTYQRVKQTQPGVRVIGGAAILTPLPWFEDLFGAGALAFMDAVVIHPYVGVPEDAEKDVAALQDLIARSNRGGQPKPIWATECGSADPGHPGRQDMARYLVRLLTILRSTGVERIHWYLMRDYGGFTTGLLHADNDPLGRYVPTSAYPAYANLVQQLHHARFVRREGTDLRTRDYVFDKEGRDLRVVWSTGSPWTLVFKTKSPLVITDIMGNSHVVRPREGAVTVVADKDPVYIRGNVEGLDEPEGDVILADSVTGFSGAQGGTPGTWSYGYYHQGDSAAYQPADFKPMTWTRNPWVYQWQCQYGYVALGATGAHPGDSDYKPVWSIRRWWSNAEGSVRLTGIATHGETGGDGVGIRIFLDGNEVYSQPLGGPDRAGSISFDVTGQVKRGSTLDFVVTPGPADDMNFDAVGFRARITQAGAAR